uniref:Trehalose 6-phosphate phosphatase n=1 Tax=Megaselia scalaris TaxID=36166 RepID=T1GN82_MEGSC
MPIEVEKALHTIAENPNVFTAVISGRGIVDVQNKVDGSRKDYELPEEIRKNYTELVHDLRRQLAKNGAWVEDKRVSLTYHYRDTPADQIEGQRLEAIRITESHGFRANQAHYAIEAKPPVNWNKGEAARFILEQKFGKDFAKDSNLRIVFAGDDTTDEDAMRVLQGIGKSFRIASDPKMETYADFRLADQQLMTPLLQFIANIYKN